MANLNQCQFIGNLGQKPEIKYTQSGVAVVNFNIAVSEKWKNRDGEKQEHTEWVRCVAWKRLAEICGEYLDKGSSVWISGKLQTRSWEDKEGNKRYTTEIVANNMQMLGGKNETREEAKGPEGTNPGDNEYPVDDNDVPF